MHICEKEAEFRKLVGLVGVGMRINEVCSGWILNLKHLLYLVHLI